MDDLATAYEWARTHKFNEEQQQYCTLLALKIFDGTCKMDYDSYNLFMSVYDGINEQEPTPFNKKVHKIIALSRTDNPIIVKEEYKEAIHLLKVTMLKHTNKTSMKAFKNFVWSNLP